MGNLQNMIGEAHAYADGMADSFNGAHAQSQNEKRKVLPGGQLTIEILRQTANIQKELPIPIFGSSALVSGFAGLFGTDMPSGVSLKSIRVGLWGAADQALPSRNMTLVYTDGSNDDTVVISAKQTDYSRLMKSLDTDKLMIKDGILMISDESKQEQFQVLLKKGVTHVLGGAHSNPTSLLQGYSPDQNQKNAIRMTFPDESRSRQVGKDDYYTMGLIAVASFKVTLSMNLAWYAKLG